MQSTKFKTCIINGQEQYAFAQIVGGSPMMTEMAAQMFPEALLSFVDLDMGKVSELISAMNACVISVADIADKEYQDEFLRILEALARQHIYFELFRLEWIDRMQQARSANILKRHWRNEKVRYLPKALEDIQRQIRDMFKYVLDYDSGNGTALEKAASYYKKTDEPIFSFRPLLMHFEFWHNDTFAEVVYPESIYDLISYHLQECIKQGLRLRICRNCGRYFHLCGRNTAIYCCRPYGEESIAELKDPTKDCRQSPEAFVLEYSAFIERVQRGVESFRLPNYEEVLPNLSQEQLHTLMGLTDSCRKTLEDYLSFVKEACANV